MTIFFNVESLSAFVDEIRSKFGTKFSTLYVERSGNNLEVALKF